MPELSLGALDPALVAEPADVHLTHAVQLCRLAGSLRGERQQITIEALGERMAMALRAIGERRLSARYSARNPSHAELTT